MSEARNLKRILPAIAIIVTVFGAIHYLIYQITTRDVPPNFPLGAWAAVLTTGILFIPAGFFASHSGKKSLRWVTWSGYIWMGVFTILFFFSLAEVALTAVYDHSRSDWVILATAFISVWSLFKGLSLPKVVHHTLMKSEIHGFKLAQISDLHIGMLHLDENWLKNVVERINAENPDVVAITGDLVEGEYSTITPKLQVLRQLAPRAQKYYITGNHEYIHGSGPWEEALKTLGFTVLHNQNHVFTFKNAKILFAGVPDRMVRRFRPDRLSSPDIALKTDQKTDYRILLAHQPTSAFDIKNESCDLVLTGHTHGGQIFPFHLLVRLVQPVLSGFKKVNGVTVFAHQGTGLWGPPMRWFSRSEIVIFEWN